MKCRNKYCPSNVQGSCSGVVVNNKPSIEQNIKQTLNNFVALQENSVAKLKEYL